MEPKNTQWYYVDESHTTRGPLTQQQLSQSLSAGEISDTTWVFNTYSQNWVRAHETTWYKNASQYAWGAAPAAVVSQVWELYEYYTGGAAAASPQTDNDYRIKRKEAKIHGNKQDGTEFAHYIGFDIINNVIVQNNLTPSAEARENFVKFMNYNSPTQEKQTHNGAVKSKHMNHWGYNLVRNPDGTQRKVPRLKSGPNYKLLGQFVDDEEIIGTYLGDKALDISIKEKLNNGGKERLTGAETKRVRQLVKVIKSGGGLKDDGLMENLAAAFSVLRDCDGKQLIRKNTKLDCTIAKQMRQEHSKSNVNVSAPDGPRKKDGTLDMRFKVNRAATSSKSSTSSSGPLKKDGTPDKRYKANRTTSASSSTWSTPTSSSSSSGPLKRDGTPDMRYKANRTSSSSTRSTSSYSTRSSSSYSSGPTKADGTPDMRYSCNRRSSSSYNSGSSYSSSGSSYSSSSSYSSGPCKADGTPDMRYACNRR